MYFCAESQKLEKFEEMEYTHNFLAVQRINSISLFVQVEHVKDPRMDNWTFVSDCSTNSERPVLIKLLRFLVNNNITVSDELNFHMIGTISILQAGQL